MTRRLRIEYTGAWYHVMNRGAARRPVFLSGRQRQRFLELLGQVHERYRLEVHAYCLMGNHYHLMVRTPEPNLQRIMRHIDGVYTQFFNFSTMRDGPLFRGRYHAVLIQAEAHWIGLSRYIHRNPLEGGLVGHLPDYPWSSYPAYLGLAESPGWLYMDYVKQSLDEHWSPTRYRRFVESGVAGDEHAEHFYDHGSHGPILGDEEFAIEAMERAGL